MRISSRLYLGFGVLLVLMSALGALVAYDMAGVDSGVRRLTTGEIPALGVYTRLARYFSMDIAQSHLYVVKPRMTHLAAARSAETLLNQALADAARPDVGADPGVMASLKQQMQDVQLAIHQAQSLARAEKLAAATALWDSEVSSPADTLSERLDDMRDNREEAAMSNAAALTEHTQHLRMFSMLAVFLALLTAIAAVGLITRSLVRPIRRLLRAVNTLAAGDLSARVEWPYGDELGLLAANFNRMADQVGATIQQLGEAQAALKERNAALSAASNAIQRELELASRIQQAILPSDCSYLGVFASAQMTAATDIGGDFYDMLPGRPGPQSFGVAIGDVSGKGIPAALMMVFVVTVLREVFRRESNPAAILRQLNRLMLGRFSTDQEMYATCFLGIVDRTTLGFTFAKAGHEEPLWYHADTGVCDDLKAAGMFLGLFEEGGYETRRIQLSAGDRLILFTDGVVEARSRTNAAFGYERLRRLVAAHGHSTAAELTAEIQKAVDAWTEGMIPRDDLTVLVVAVLGPEAVGLSAAADLAEVIGSSEAVDSSHAIDPSEV